MPSPVAEEAERTHNLVRHGTFSDFSWRLSERFPLNHAQRQFEFDFAPGSSSIPRASLRRTSSSFMCYVAGHADEAQQLLQAGADTSIKDNHGKTALDLANENGDCVELLRRASSA